jgi:hypothetical protein
MNDELRLISELTAGTYKNSVGSEIAVFKLQENVLMTAREIAKLYGVGRPCITRHIHKLYQAGTLAKKRVSYVLPHRARDGKLYETRYYNAAAVLAVGLSVKSPEATFFKQWLLADLQRSLR